MIVVGLEHLDEILTASWLLDEKFRQDSVFTLQVGIQVNH
jgi:hypothetical protein